jgi:hypothetical protein
MATEQINKYRVWCNTENKPKYIWGEEAPTVCPSGHPIDQTKTSIVEYIDNDVSRVLVEEQELDESKRTSGHFQSSTFNVPVPSGTPGQMTCKDFSYPIPICLLSAQVLTEAHNVGDTFEVQVSPDTVIGWCTQNPDPSGYVLNVSDTVITNIDVGYKVEIFDGQKLADLGRCISIDSSLSQITTEFTPDGQTFLASSPTYVMITVEMVRQFNIFGTGRIEIGESKIGGSYIPANTPIRVCYINNDSLEKRFDAEVEYLY